jgi:hypothetical protein
MLAALMLLATVALIGVGAAMVQAGLVAALLATPQDAWLSLPPRPVFLAIAGVGLLLFTIAAMAAAPQIV